MSFFRLTFLPFRVFLVPLLLAVGRGAHGQVPAAAGQNPGSAPMPAAVVLAGPMVGFVAPTTAKLWVQATPGTTVWIHVQAEDEPQLHRRQAVVVTFENQGIAHFLVDSLRPATRYSYQVGLNGQLAPAAAKYTFRTAPLGPGSAQAPLPDFTFATGSCAAVHDPYGDWAGYNIFAAMHQARPDLMLWLGDNVYLNAGEWADVGRRRARYAHTRALPQLQPLLANAANVAIWDDHDFGPNDADRTSVRRAEARAVFDAYWPNPPLARPESNGLTTAFSWGDADFFLLDNRSFRSPDQTARRTRTQLGRDQLRWLLTRLRQSTATFKFVATGGQVLSPNRRGETLAHRYGKERRQLLDSLRAMQIPGLIFLTGDRHFTELTRWQRRGVLAYDLTVSPFTSDPVRRGHRNRWRVKNTWVPEHNFATLRLSGPATARRLTVTVVGTDGQARWTREIAAREWELAPFHRPGLPAQNPRTNS